MSKRDLLIEIGTEELPPKALSSLSEAFTNSITQQLAAEELSFDGVEGFASPRRLAVVVRQLDEQAPSKDIEKWGPPVKVAFKDGQATKAAEAFAKSNGLALDELSNYIANDGKQDNKVAELKQGQYFGEAALITDEPRNATIVAREPAVFYALGKNDFRAVLETSATFEEELRQALFNRQ